MWVIVGEKRMSFVREETDDTTIVRFYSMDETITNIDALIWLNNIASVNGMTADHFYYEGIGNDGKHAEAYADYVTLLKKIREGKIKLMCLKGWFRWRPIVIGVNLEERYAYITIRKNIPADYKYLEKELRLA